MINQYVYIGIASSAHYATVVLHPCLIHKLVFCFHNMYLVMYTNTLTIVLPRSITMTGTSLTSHWLAVSCREPTAIKEHFIN